MIWLFACAAHQAGPEAALPKPLPRTRFTLPELQRATLSNDLPVLLAENHEIPMVWGSVAFKLGAWADPPGKEGLVEATMAMLTLGAGELDSLGFSAAVRKLGSSVESSAGLDGGSIGFSTLRRNLDPTLALVEAVLEKPSFPATEWDYLRQKQLNRLEHVRNDPNQVASRVLWRVVHGDRYRGRLSSEASLGAIRLEDMRAMHAHLAPVQSLLLVGGDITMAELLPLLEARLGDWAGSPVQAAPLQAPPEAMATSIQLVDFPGKAQSVVRMAAHAGRPTDPDHDAFDLANTAVGGQFTARINMNLREQKGWTYGARSSVWFDFLGAWWTFNAGIQTPHTAEAIRETLAELAAPEKDRPILDAELDAARDGLVLAYPLAFEDTGYLLGQERDIWRYGLPDDNVSTYVRRMEQVSLPKANAAWGRRIDPGRMVIVVAGDAAAVRPGLEQLGFPIVERTADGDLKTR